MKTFETYKEACDDAVKHLEGKENCFKIFQIPRDEQGRFTWEIIEVKQ